MRRLPESGTDRLGAALVHELDSVSAADEAEGDRGGGEREGWVDMGERRCSCRGLGGGSESCGGGVGNALASMARICSLLLPSRLAASCTGASCSAPCRLHGCKVLPCEQPRFHSVSACPACAQLQDAAQ